MLTGDSVEIQKAVGWAEQRERRARFPLSRLLVRLYRIRPLRPILLPAVLKLEGGQMFSRTLRQILREQYGVTAGLYSYGPCLKPGVLPPGTVIGNYCSFADGMMVFRRNHPTGRLSMHPFFFNQDIGLLPHDTVSSLAENPLTFGHDVWVGAQVIILPKCKTIGNGAVIGAGAVVTRDVPAFAVVGGNPARTIGSRFPAEVQSAICASEWWLRPLPELLEHLPLFTRPLSNIETGIPGRIGAKMPGENRRPPEGMKPDS